MSLFMKQKCGAVSHHRFEVLEDLEKWNDCTPHSTDMKHGPSRTVNNTKAERSVSVAALSKFSRFRTGQRENTFANMSCSIGTKNVPSNDHKYKRFLETNQPGW